MKPWCLGVLVFFLSLSAAFAAVQPYEKLSDPVLQARAEQLYKELRCVACQSQSIDSSNAPVAAALRAAVRERLEKGASDEAILSYMQERYGDMVLMKPPLKPRTWGLWLMPLITLAIGGAMAAKTMRGKNQ